MSIDQCNEIETFKEVLSGPVVPIFMSKPPAAALMERGWPRGPSVDISKQFLLSPNLSRLNLFSDRRGGRLRGNLVWVPQTFVSSPLFTAN